MGGLVWDDMELLGWYFGIVRRDILVVVFFWIEIEDRVGLWGLEVE